MGIIGVVCRRAGEDPLEAFNRMIREKEERAKRREEERRRLHSASPLSRSRSPRPRSRTRSRTPASHGSRLRSHSRPLSRPRYSRLVIGLVSMILHILFWSFYYIYPDCRFISIVGFCLLYILLILHAKCFYLSMLVIHGGVLVLYARF